MGLLIYCIWLSLQYTWWQMQYTQVGLLKYSMASAVHLMANVVHSSVAPDVRWWPLQYTWWQLRYTQVRLLMYMMASVVHLMVNPVHLLANAVQPSEAPDEHDRICSTRLQTQYTQVGPWYTVHDCLYSTLDGKCSTPKWGSWSTAWPLQ